MRETLILGLCLMVCTVQAQSDATDANDDAIATDRPLQSETPYIVPKGLHQFEMGLQYTGGVSAFESDIISAPQLQYRWGFANNGELRVSTNYLNVSTDEPGVDVDGIDAPVIGLKSAIIKETKKRPQLSGTVQFTLPFLGSDDFTPENPVFGYRLTMAKNLKGSWYLLGSFGGEWASEEYVPFSVYTVQTGFGLGGNWGLMLEYYGFGGANRDNHNGINGGLVFQSDNNHQFDLSGGTGLTEDFYTYYVGIGYAMRFGNRK